MAEPVINKTDSILEQVKKMLGMTKDYTAFDVDILLHINTVMSNLTQMGIGPETGFMVDGYDQSWEDFVTESDALLIQQLKSYIPAKVRMLFDPPTNPNVLTALKNNIEEMEFRLFVQEEMTRYAATVVEEESS